MIARSNISVTEKRTARVFDNATHGLTIGHLRAFLEEADKVKLIPETRVHLSDKLQPGSSWSTVEITASNQEVSGPGDL